MFEKIIEVCVGTNSVGMILRSTKNCSNTVLVNDNKKGYPYKMPEKVIGWDVKKDYIISAKLNKSEILNSVILKNNSEIVFEPHFKKADELNLCFRIM